MHAHYKSQTAFDILAAQLRKRLGARPATEFTVIVREALQAIELNDSPNNAEAVLLLDACVSCEERKDELTAKLLLYLSGVVTKPEMVRATLMAIDTWMKRAVVPNQPPHSHD